MTPKKCFDFFKEMMKRCDVPLSGHYVCELYFNQITIVNNNNQTRRAWWNILLLKYDTISRFFDSLERDEIGFDTPPFSSILLLFTVKLRVCERKGGQHDVANCYSLRRPLTPVWISPLACSRPNQRLTQSTTLCKHHDTWEILKQPRQQSIFQRFLCIKIQRWLHF